MAGGFWWNKAGDKQVRASRIREIGVYDKSRQTVEKDGAVIRHPRFEVYGWFNADEFFAFGSFGSEQEAKAFVEALE